MQSLALPYGIPSPGHRLKWTAPSRWAIPPYNSSVQQDECTPFVIQRSNFFQMFPNKQQNKIKDFFPSTTKPNGPNFPSLQTMAEFGGWISGQRENAGTWCLTYRRNTVCVCVCLCVCFGFTHTFHLLGLFIKDSAIIWGRSKLNSKTGRQRWSACLSFCTFLSWWTALTHLQKKAIKSWDIMKNQFHLHFIWKCQWC